VTGNPAAPVGTRAFSGRRIAGNPNRPRCPRNPAINRLNKLLILRIFLGTSSGFTTGAATLLLIFFIFECTDELPKGICPPRCNHSWWLVPARERVHFHARDETRRIQ